jgi:hypothetical protein
MRGLLERLNTVIVADSLDESKSGKKSPLDKFKEKHGIVSQKAKPSHCVHSIGFSEKEQKWYGWSHRAIAGFGKGDKIFEPNFGDDKTPFVKHGKMPIRNMADAEKSARGFAEYVS